MEAVLEPLKEYLEKYKALHDKNLEDYFNELTKISSVNKEENKITVDKLNSQRKNIADTEKKLSSQKLFRGLIIALMVILSIALAIIGFYLYSISNDNLVFLILCLCGVVLIIVGGIILIKKTFNIKINDLNKTLSSQNEIAKTLENNAWKQMAPLNALFDYNIPGRILNKTIPLLQMDENFDEEKFILMKERYGFEENNFKNISTYYVQSGSILGNPFLICRDHIQKWSDKVYTGFKTIHWTTTERTKYGFETVHHSQTLTATITKPAPNYSYNTYLMYANEVAPDLSFSRHPSQGSKLEERSLASFIKKEIKRLDKKAEESLKNGGGFTRLGNDEFEALFGAEDRDNEVEYRLLYTPLAQKNIINLLRSKEGFGDDFIQKKDKKINYILSEHSQQFDYYSSPLNYLDYDYEKIKGKFFDFNHNYFKGLFFDLAPLLSIPLYQQHKAKEFIYNEPLKKHLSSYEHEAIANSFDKDLLTPPGAITPSIIKIDYLNKLKDGDEVNVIAHSFKGESRVEYISRFGADGRSHLVPVWYVEYIPISKTTKMVIEKKNSTRQEFNIKKEEPDFKEKLKELNSKGSLFERGIFATLVASSINSNSIDALNKIYPGHKEIIKDKLNDLELVNKIFKEQEEEVKINQKNENFDKGEELIKDKQSDEEEE